MHWHVAFGVVWQHFIRYGQALTVRDFVTADTTDHFLRLSLSLSYQDQLCQSTQDSIERINSAFQVYKSSLTTSMKASSFLLQIH